MAKKTPSLPSAAELTASSGRTHPIVSAVQFAESTRNTGGATMNVHTGNVLRAGEEAYAVGGAADQSKRGTPRVRTKRLPLMKDRDGKKVADMPLTTVLAERDRIRQTGRTDPGRSLGSWDARTSEAGPRENIDIDASDVISDRQQAVTLGTQRGEDAIYDLKRGRDIRTR